MMVSTDRRGGDWVARLRWQGARLLRTPAPVLDADVHLTAWSAVPEAVRRRCEEEVDYFHGRPMDAEGLLAEMDLAGIEMALIWQNPATTPSDGREEANEAALVEANRAVAEAAERYPERFLAAGWVDPRALGAERARVLVRRCCREWGMFVVKMNPAQNRYPMDSAEVTEMVLAIVEEGAVPAFHYGADSPFTPPSALEHLARRLMPHPLIAVHGGGGGGSYLEQERMAAASRAVALRCENVFVVHSAKRDTHMASDLLALAEAGPGAWARLGLGSDAPYGRMGWNFGGGRALLEQLMERRHPETARRPGFPGWSAEAVADYLGGNAARFLAGAMERFLRRQEEMGKGG